MPNIIWNPNQARQDADRRARAEQLAAAREAVKTCITKMDELEAAAKTWRVRPDHAEGIYLRTSLASQRAIVELMSTIPALIEGLEQSGEALLQEMRNEAAKMYESILVFRRLIGTLQEDNESGNLLGADRAVNQAVRTLVSQLSDAMRKIVQPPPRREFKIERSWWIAASVVAGLVALYSVSTIMANRNATLEHILDYGLVRCEHNRAFGKGHQIYCPLSNFASAKWPGSEALVREIEANINKKPEYGGMRF
ncbi:hypothetical protein [Acidiphilium sp.]|uniref:hypothetical protein n=1 Tax=Acidiphilium sp. TaxID=527 RepID=UPI003D08D9F6